MGRKTQTNNLYVEYDHQCEAHQNVESINSRIIKAVNDDLPLPSSPSGRRGQDPWIVYGYNGKRSDHSQRRSGTHSGKL